MQKRLDWNEYFLQIALSVAARSTCLRRKYGAVITDNTNTIVGTGFNGAPRGVPNCVDKGVCIRNQLGIAKGQMYEICEAVHAEQNAIINSDPARMRGGVIYIAGLEADGTFADGEPCLLCSRAIINARIAKAVFYNKEGQIKVVDVCPDWVVAKMQAFTNQRLSDALKNNF